MIAEKERKDGLQTEQLFRAFEIIHIFDRLINEKERESSRKNSCTPYLLNSGVTPPQQMGQMHPRFERSLILYRGLCIFVCIFIRVLIVIYLGKT